MFVWIDQAIAGTATAEAMHQISSTVAASLYDADEGSLSPPPDVTLR
jgi:hypothetical protein